MTEEIVTLAVGALLALALGYASSAIAYRRLKKAFFSEVHDEPQEEGGEA